MPTCSRTRCARLQSWLVSVGYTGRVTAETRFEHHTQAAPDLTGAEGAARGRITRGRVGGPRGAQR
jgi:hypothetical protein